MKNTKNLFENGFIKNQLKIGCFDFKTLIISFIFFFPPTFFGINASASEFLNTTDGETKSVVYGDGSELGFYFQVSFLVDEKILPRISLTPPMSKEEEDRQKQYEQEQVIKLQPQLVFLNNTALCEIFQGPYYSTDDFIAPSKQLTYAYLIKTTAEQKNTSCKLVIYLSNGTTQLREIQYFTQIGKD